MKICKLGYIQNIFILSGLVVLFLLTSCDTEEDVKPEPTTVTVGAILSLTGQWSTLGINSRAALELATSDINQYFETSGFNTRVDVKVYDSELDPDKALSHLESAVGEGIEVIIGPQSSSELAALKPFADNNDVMVISNGSTAGSLSIPNDNVFRFCPDGNLEGQALAQLIYDDGIRELVTASRDDVGNTGLQTDLVKAFTDLGGTVNSLEPYASDLSDFGEVIAEIQSYLSESINNSGEESTGVYLAAFDEGVSLFEQAASNSVLSSVRWYGGDGLVSSEALINNADAAGFAIATEFIAPNFALPESARMDWEPLSDAIEAKTGSSASAFAIAAYDALWVTAFTLETNQNATSGFAGFKEAFQETARLFVGATGSTQLNNNGDRSIAAFGFWGVEKVNDVYQWKLVSTSE